MLMCALRLRCKSEFGTHVIEGLTSSSTIYELMQEVEKIAGVKPCSQKILTGYPLKPLNLNNRTSTLESLSIKSGDTFTVVNNDTAKAVEKPQKSVMKNPGVRRMEVPADNSCLFYSIFFVINGYLEYEDARKLRENIAQKVMSDPERFTPAVLGKNQYEYSAWIQSDTSWGGAIELSILCEIYGVEIAAVDIKTLRMDTYGQDKHFSSRVYLIYDGIHYDPLYFDPCNDQLPMQTVFSVNDHSMLTSVLALAEVAKKARQFTDTGNFTLICSTCQQKLTGQTEAQAHAKNTGHGNFSEC